MKKPQAGFTLMEVLLAVAILAIVTVTLLWRRVEIIRDTAHARDQRMAWSLLAQEMAKIELDPEIFLSDTGAERGDFKDLGPEYAGFEYRWEMSKVDVPTNDPTSKTEQPKKIFLVTLSIRKIDEEGDLATMQAMFPIPSTKSKETTTESK